MSLPIKDSLSRISSWFGENGQQLSFNKGAKPAEINAAQKKLGREFPAQLIEYLTACNGEADSSIGPIGNWNLLELKYIVKEWQRMTKLLDEGLFDTENVIDSAGYVKNNWWNRGWLPIVSSGSGHLFCIDTDPGQQGQVGQIMLFLHDDDKRFLVADSLQQWLAKISTALSARRFYLVTDDDGYRHFNNEAFMWISLEGRDIYGKENC